MLSSVGAVPAAVRSRREMLLREENETEQSIFREIETGMGPDMDQLGERQLTAVPSSLSEEGNYGRCSGDRPSHDRMASFHRYFLHAEKDSILNGSLPIPRSEKDQKRRPFALQIKVYAEEGSQCGAYDAVRCWEWKYWISRDIGGLLEERRLRVNWSKWSWVRKSVIYRRRLMTLKGGWKFLHRSHRLSGFCRSASRYELCGPPSGQERPGA